MAAPLLAPLPFGEDLMGRIGLAERSDLAEWGRTRAAAGELPRLVRRLILETASVVELGFPADEGVSVGGWDGTARTTIATVQMPEGLSLWEISNQASPEKKADADYDKRTETPNGTPTTEAAYVALTSRPWPSRGAWSARREREGRWREVRAYGLDDLHLWLEDAPVAHAWISEKLGLRPHGLLTAQTRWERWSSATMPALPPKVVLAGREAVAEQLNTLLAAEGKIVTVAASSREDVHGFVAALAANDGGALSARVVFVDSVETWRHLRDRPRPLVIVPLNADVAEQMDSHNVHHIVAPVLGDDGDFVLPPIDAQIAGEALREIGVEEERAGEVGALARLSLLAARRRIAVKRELHRPAWADAPIERLVRRVVLLGRFSERMDGDRAIVSDVLGDVDTVVEQLAGYTAAQDPLVVRLGATLAVVSPFDAWLLTRSLVRRDDVEAFHRAAVRVLAEVDPALEMDRSERWLAGTRGKIRDYSGDLRRGIATTLAILGGHGESTVPATTMTAASWAGWIVREILSAANANPHGHLWASLCDVLPLLAESAPDEFLSAVRDGLAGDRPVLANMFEDADDVSALFASSAHSALLWALETVSWSPRHFGQSVELLARLAEIDPGGKLGNRPRGSLVSLFRPWYPQSSVSTERRVDVLDALRARHPRVAWELMVSLLPDPHGFAMHISSPKYRDWRPSAVTPTRTEYWSFVDELFTRILDDADSDATRLATLIDKLTDLPPKSVAALFGHLERRVDALDGAGRATIWSVARAEASRNREFAEAEWALPEQETARLEALIARVQPESATVRWRWLFDDHLPWVPGVDDEQGFAEWEAAVERLRAEATREIVAEGSWDDVLAFAREISQPWAFGVSLANADIDRHEDELLALLDQADGDESQFASSYFSQRFRAHGWRWIDRVMEQELTPCQRARLLLATHDHPISWNRAEACGDEVEAAFWREFPPHGLGADFLHSGHVATRMIGVGRVGAALDHLALYLSRKDDQQLADLVARGLEMLLEQSDDRSLHRLGGYGLRRLFDHLVRSGIDEGRLARLEWSYLPAFEFRAAPPTLSRHLADNPDLFVEVVSRVYKPDDDAEQAERGDEDGGPPEQEQVIALNAYRLLSEWRMLPGRDGDLVDSAALQTWIDRARQRLRDEKRLKVGDLQIGRLLAASPPDPDGTWPCVAVRETLERLQSPWVERGMETEMFNSIGVTSRELLDGGEQERNRAARHREQADRLHDRWPRAAAVLHEAAEQLESVARRYDDEAERRRSGFDR